MTRATRLLVRRSRMRRRLTAAIVGVVLLGALAGGIAWAAISSQIGPLTACFSDSTGGAVKVGSYPVWTEYDHACPRGTHVRHAASADGTTPTTAPSPTTTTKPATTTTAVATTTTTAPVTTTTHAPTTTSTTSTTKPPTTTTTKPGPVGSGPPAAGGYFTIKPPGTPFPTNAQCLAQIHRSTWEPRHDNDTANHAQTTNTLANFGQFTAAWNVNYKPRIAGNFSGTTDEIIQYEACRWNWSDEWVRAEAVVESTWHQSTVGDLNNSKGSYGLLQIKVDFHPNVNNRCKTCAGTSWPNSQNSTSWNVDQQIAELRGCYDGQEPYLGNTTGDLDGCLGQWYSGSWHDSGAQTYIGWVHNAFNAKAWRGWSG